MNQGDLIQWIQAVISVVSAWANILASSSTFERWIWYDVHVKQTFELNIIKPLKKGGGGINVNLDR